MIEFTRTETKQDLWGILALQKENLIQNISAEEKETQGFVRVQHSIEDMESLHSIEPHIIAKDGHLVAAYCLAMTKHSREDIPMLIPMFEQFEKLDFKGKKASEYNYMSVGQVCVGKDYRGQGIFQRLYETYRDTFREKYEFAITEVSTQNLRSLKAHQKIGFEVVKTFKDEFEEWAIVIWDWR